MNLVGAISSAYVVFPLIRDGIQGRIIQINSKSGKSGRKHNSGYSAAKFGGVGLAVSGAGSGGIRHYRTLVDARQPVEIADVPVTAAAKYATKLGIKPDEVEQYY